VAPIEVFFGMIVFIFSLIGLARGFLRELGVTTVMMFVLFFLSRFEPVLDTGIVRAMSLSGQDVTESSQDLLKCWLYVVIIVAAAFVSYQGETLSFAGQPPRGAQGIAFGLLTGLLNGYLVAGSIWYYLDRFSYPIRFLGFSAGNLSTLASGMLPLLPISFLGKPIFLGQSLLLFLSGMLLLARVIR